MEGQEEIGMSDKQFAGYADKVLEMVRMAIELLEKDDRDGGMAVLERVERTLGKDAKE